MTLHNDEPVLDDRLERWPLVREVGDAIASCDPPQVFGLHGDWGSGKTSFLHQLQFYLVGDSPQHTDAEVNTVKARLGTQLPAGKHKDRATVVWFEAWRYQNEAVPVVALLHEMRSQMAWYLKGLARLKKAMAVTVKGALFSMEELTRKIGIQASQIQKVGEKWEEEHLAVTLPSHTIREQLQAAIGAILPQVAPGKDPRVVVLIDDLDRCQPDVAYRLLEGLKIYLTLPNCVFVLGMNQQIVEEAIARCVPAPPGSDALRAERAAAYLEKLCQNVWRVPRVGNPKQFLLDLLPDDVVRQWLDGAIGDHACLPPNPRRIKGLANLVQRFRARLPRQEGDADDPAMVVEARRMLIVAYVYQFHPDLYRLWESDLAVGRYLLDWARFKPVRLMQPETTDEEEEEKRLPLHRVLGRLRRAESIRADPTTPVPEYRCQTALPDPADWNVFWVQGLLHDVMLAPGADLQAFARYLRGNEPPGSEAP